MLRVRKGLNRVIVGAFKVEGEGSLVREMYKEKVSEV